MERFLPDWSLYSKCMQEHKENYIRKITIKLQMYYLEDLSKEEFLIMLFSVELTNCATDFLVW